MCTTTAEVRIVECGCCGAYHRTNFDGDCRNDLERIPSPDEAAHRFGLPVIEVFFEDEDDPNKVTGEVLLIEDSQCQRDRVASECADDPTIDDFDESGQRIR